MENNKSDLPLNIKIKKERISPQKELTPPLSNLKEEKHDVLAVPTEEEEQKKVVVPVKSSNEMLAELFQVFNAAPPKSLLSNNITDLLRGTKAKKHHRKKHKRKHEEADSESESDHHTKSKKKKKSSKKIKEEAVETTKHLEDGELETTTAKDKKHSKKSKKRKKSKTRSPEKDAKVKSEKVDQVKVDKVERSVSASNNKIQINLKNIKFVDVPNEAKHKYDHDDFSSELSLSDEFDDSNSVHYGDKRFNDFYRSHQHSYRSRSRDKHHRTSPRQSSRDRDFYRHDDRYGTSRRTSNYHTSSRYRSYSRSRSRSRSRSGERIDKKRLLEIARKNAITMLKSGTLPGSQHLAPDIKEKALEKMRYGGKTIEELTEYCRKLSKGECLGDLSSISGEDSDHDKEGNQKAFHHPFVLKERGPIVMNIKNAVPIAPKTAEQTKALLMQYPVSSGQQHRLNESEWVPVKPTKPSESAAGSSSIPKSKTKSDHLIPYPFKRFIANWTESSRQTVQSGQASRMPFDEWAIKTAPSDVAESTVTLPVVVPGNVPIQYPIGRPTYETVPPVDAPPVNTAPTQAAGNLDISSIITQRLNAMRKLQDNPQDGEAQLLMNTAQDSMSAWLSSKHTPGQFIGSTGATILTAKQLSPGLQAWAKKDQLVMTQPVAGGMGMHLLQKMGWKPGEGLGKDKSGALIPLLLEVKLDKKGLLANEENPANQQKRRINKKVLAANVEHKHPVSLLGELAAKRKWQTPVYDMVDESGPGHNKNFLFKVIVNGQEFLPTVPAANKKEAKAITAKFALQQMGVLTS